MVNLRLGCPCECLSSSDDPMVLKDREVFSMPTMNITHPSRRRGMYPAWKGREHRQCLSFTDTTLVSW